MSCVNPHRCHRHQQRQRGVPDVVKCGGTAGITCLTLQPVLALVSMNMTFSSLALCSPSSIVICLQEKKSHFTGEALTYTALTCCRCLVHNTQYNSRNDIRNAPFLFQICFVPDKHDDDVTSSLCPDVIDPFRSLLE